MPQFEKITIKLLLFISSVIPLSVYGQTAAQEFFNTGVERANSKDYTGAIAAYDSAINIDPIYLDAYYNRATAEFYIEDYKAAIVDFGKTLNFKPGLLKAYTNRGMARLKINDIKGAIQDFDMAAKIDPNDAKVYFMRGEVKLENKDIKGGCYDLGKANDMGDVRAQKYLKQYCGDMPYTKAADTQNGYLKLDWPTEEGWKIVSDQTEDNGRKVTQLLKNDETLADWTEMGTMIVDRSLHGMPVQDAINVMYNDAKKNCTIAYIEVIEKNEKVKYPWVIFKIECGSAEAPQSQVWQIVDGPNEMYINIRAIKKKKVPKKLQEKWVEFFKSAQIVME